MKNFKKHLNLSNLIFAFAVVYILYLKIPTWIDHSKKQGLAIKPQTYTAYTSSSSPKEIQFPYKDKRSIAIFWATWCGPCKLEMKRLKNSVLDHKIAKDQIIAINSFEDLDLQIKHIKENQYPFLFIQAPQISKILDISVTPTTAFFDKTRVYDLSTGMSLIGIKRAENFTSENY